MSDFEKGIGNGLGNGIVIGGGLLLLYYLLKKADKIELFPDVPPIESPIDIPDPLSDIELPVEIPVYDPEKNGDVPDSRGEPNPETDGDFSSSKDTGSKTNKGSKTAKEMFGDVPSIKDVDIDDRYKEIYYGTTDLESYYNGEKKTITETIEYVKDVVDETVNNVTEIINDVIGNDTVSETVVISEPTKPTQPTQTVSYKSDVKTTLNDVISLLGISKKEIEYGYTPTLTDLVTMKNAGIESEWIKAWSQMIADDASILLRSGRIYTEDSDSFDWADWPVLNVGGVDQYFVGKRGVDYDVSNNGTGHATVRESGDSDSRSGPTTRTYMYSGGDWYSYTDSNGVEHFNDRPGEPVDYNKII